ncbi:sensor domain-containing diguanylate cyclase [Salinisphaera sp. PC39]|uniref:GGDEF domain-containing protein n=1 Tax=Salinisphaera sp. PC39 TaxID=1304156 RepID=UPI003340959E
MTCPLTPTSEERRLAALHSLGILDTAPEERFERLTRLARRLFRVPISLVSLVDRDRQWFKSAQGLANRETPLEMSFCSHAIQNDRIMVVPDARHDPRFASNPLVVGEPHIRFYAGCPLQHPDGNMLGTLCIIDNRPRQFDDDDRQALADLAAVVEHELVVSELTILDELTGIPNRRGFVALAGQALSIASRQRLPVCLAWIDLDGFKSINDRLGHAEGDRVLLDFANRLRAVFRDSDVVGRLGGDEFAVLLPDVSAADAHKSIERLQASTDEGDMPECPVTFSVGLVDAGPPAPLSLDDLLMRADRAMYENKKRRNERRSRL